MHEPHSLKTASGSSNAKGSSLNRSFKALAFAHSIRYGIPVERLHRLPPSGRQLMILGRVPHASDRICLSELAYWPVGLGKPRELSHILFYVMVEKYRLDFLFLGPWSPLVSLSMMLSML